MTFKSEKEIWSGATPSIVVELIVVLYGSIIHRQWVIYLGVSCMVFVFGITISRVIRFKKER